jgi:hypothetical protein
MGRGPDPEDADTFSPRALPALREAVADLSWLMGRGYAEGAAVELVGNRLQLTARQRQAVWRCACADARVQARSARRLEVSELVGPVAVDGFNVLITLERALGGGPVLIGRDGAWRDLAGVHGTWRSAATTAAAIESVGRVLGGVDTTWVLDRPVSNAGRLATTLRLRAARADWPWVVRVEGDADQVLLDFDGTVATSDGGILDRCGPWVAIEPAALEGHDVWRVDLG